MRINFSIGFGIYLIALKAALCAEPLQLNYLPNVPVHLKSTVEWHMGNPLPNHLIDTLGTQVVATDLLLKGETGIPQQNPPFNLIVTLKNLQLDTVTNGIPAGFSTPSPSSSLPLAQVQRLLNRPIPLLFDAKGVILEKNDSFQQIYKELPALQKMRLTAILTEWFNPLFALAGKELKVGAKYSVELEKNAFTPHFEYEVIEINDQEVKAQFTGQVDKTDVNLATLQTCLNLTGTIKGQVTWKRQNALLCNTQAHYEVSCTIKRNEATWTLHTLIDHQMQVID